jgi:hypothetical protein
VTAKDFGLATSALRPETMLNGRRLSDQARFRDRDTIQIGGFVLDTQLSHRRTTLFEVGAASAGK